MPKARLRADEIDRYLTLVAALPLPGDQAQQLAARLRPWAEADDGKPTYMLNLNRYFAELRPFRVRPSSRRGHTKPTRTTTSASPESGCGTPPILFSTARRRASR